jgi:hypothetical protein
MPEPTCPACGDLQVAPIEYGYPTPELWEAEEAGNAVLGGCVIQDDQPAWACKVCGARWATE